MTLLNRMIGEETFLQGKYISVGVNSSGSIGTRNYAPTGFNTDEAAGYKRLGLVGDTDGFGTGKAAMHDAVVRGMCIEGFSIGYKTGGKTFVHSNQELDGLTEIAGDASTAASGKAVEADWKGATTEKLGVDQKIILTDDAKYLRIEVTLTNNSSSAMNDLRYLRTVDPDLGDGFSTVNSIVRQGKDGALVTAAASATGNPMFLYANDARAVVSTGGFINEDPYATLVNTAQAVGTTTKTDVAMSVNFSVGTLDAGKSTTLVFYMGVTDNLKATIAEIDALGDAPVVTPPVNTAPEAVNDALTIAAGASGTGNVLANDKDANGDALTAALKTGPAHGTVTLKADGSYVYKADAGFSGSDSFTYTASDGKASDTATVAITVKAPVNTAPVANNDALTVAANGSGTGNVLANDKDADGDALTAALKTGPAHGTLTLKADGSYVYQADAGFSGADSFTYTASDGKATDTATVAITVKPPVNTAPVASDDTLKVTAGTTGTGNVLANDKDADGDALTAALKTGPSHGTVTLKADGSYAYKADAGFSGTDSFTYTASDGKATDTATVAITVNAPVNNSPFAAGDTLKITAGTTGTGNVLANDKDADGDALTATLQGGPSHGTVTLNADGSFVYKAAAGYVGTDSFTYAASDGKASDTATVAITIAAPPPVVPGLPDSPLLQRAGTLNGSAATSDLLTGSDTHNTFYFDLAAKSGYDKIANFGTDDILVTKGNIYDSNGDGIINFSRNKLNIDAGANGTDAISMPGMSSLRYLGTDEDGLSVYANTLVRPKGAIEGTIGNDTLSGDALDLKKGVFFFDTALAINLGNDRIDNFGAKDLLVTTTKLSTTSLGSSGVVKLVGGSVDAGDALIPGDAGTVELHGLNGSAVQSLEFDGSVTRGGVTYYVYSAAHSTVGLTDLAF